VYKIGESIAMERLGLFISPFREVNFAELSTARPGFVFSAVSHHVPTGGAEKHGLICWDFQQGVGQVVEKSYVRGKLELVTFEDEESDTGLIRSLEEREIWIVLE
jgi:hypothetical protein